MTKLYLLFIALWAVLGLCVGQIVQPGQCDPNIQLQEDLTWEQFEGTWYEIHRTATPEQNTDCAQFDMILNENLDDSVIVHHYGLRNNFEQESRGTARSSSIPAKLILDIPKFNRPIDFWVLQGGNETFSIVYNCENIGTDSRSINLWILSNSRNYVTPMVRQYINTFLTQTFNIGLDNLQEVDHSDTACYELPEINPGESVILPGKCDLNIPVQQNFDVAAFTGTWHQIASYHTDNSDGACVRAEYKVGEGVVDVINSQVINQQLLTITGVATVTSTDLSAKLKVILNISPGVTVEQELWVISTDYTGYAVSYSCEELDNDRKRIYSWILSRERVLNYDSNIEVNKVIDSILELNTIYYQTTDHSPASCFYFPQPSNGPVIFRGQCEDEVPPVKQDFETARYMGLWYNVELYPALFQDGTCSNAFYELKDRVEVRNTQVKDGILDVINAFGVPASDDGSAKLRVTFPIAGTDNTITTDYWVLDTNYDSYAFVYSCFNIDSDRMQVGSWKLSRSKTLSGTDNAAIERVINTAKVLDQRYFNEVNQTEAGCFFVPVPEEDVPVVFPGQCDPTLGMPNFDFARFEGEWHEIEAYPKLEQTGQCIKHKYEVQLPSGFSLMSSSVYDQFYLETRGVVTATDSSGRLTITINTEDGVITIPFWIIDTDYTNYALAYACVNREGNFREVWSWKLSRTKELSTNANTAIDNAIANIDVLSNEYYWPIDQSERACYTLPVLGPGEPIILDGVCDTAIEPITNFNPTWFSGRWRLLESYPFDSKTGTCNEVTFNDIAGQFTVTYEQVLDQTLNSISSTATLSADERGSLQISFPGAESATYLILGTDYDSYALLYRCDNINASQKRVWSWKLSRRNSFTNDANAAMNAIINNVNVLNNRYFDDIKRTEADCFYFPEADDNTPVLFRGRCNENINVVQNFDAVSYQGLWHDIQSYPEPFQSGTCQNAYYALAGAGVDVYNTQVVNQRLDTMSGTAVLAGNDGSAKLDVTFEVGGNNVTTNYWVLDTDYSSYALVYSCRPVNEEYFLVSSWKLSRTRSLSNPANQRIEEVIRDIPVLDDRYYLRRDQTESGCFYFPEPEENKPVVFPGQCDENIDTVQNFNIAEFQGTWHEIEAYPKDEQTGDCVNHQYTYVNGQPIDLVSSSIRDQRRSFTSAEVTGSSGRLTITINAGGAPMTIPFWIIDVQYNDYALAYSCVNRNDSHRAVYSWKLSRTKQLSPLAQSAINNAIANINVLDNRYYENIDQSDEACFYLPDISPGEPVIFPGTCDESIKGVENFDLSKLNGHWKVIERYPSGVETTCNEATYSRIDDVTVNAVHTYVVDTTLTSISGTVRVSSSDSSGTLRFTPNAGGESADYIVLGTDYESYALVYQCENIMSGQNQYRKVMSWKLSPNNALDETAINNINTIVNRIDVLNSRYYYNVNRTEAGCFYFPEANDNLPVRFRGRCDENIPVVTNFNAVRYQGLWYDIQSYPERFQDGTCQNAYYALDDDGVDVYNTQVVNQRLDTMSGRAVVVSGDGSAKLDVTFEVGGINVTSNYWVLATDYDSYSLVYSCRPVDTDYYQVTSWKLSRSKTLSMEAAQAIDTVTKEIPVLDDRYYLNRDQSEAGCFYFPEPEENKPVVFPGQCDDNIDTVENFNFAEFQGTWYEIEAYPKDEQTGECVSHRYNYTNGQALSLESSSVRDQRRIINTGAVTGSNGRLIMTIVSDSTLRTIPFWIIDVQYNDYALAYSCVNRNDSHRAVYSWKLSRTKQLSPSAQSAINNAIANINVLDNRYYENIDQTDNACFYLPDLVPGEPAIFPGRCDEGIKGIENFYLSMLTGRWRVIERYPSGVETTCNEATYSRIDDVTVNAVHTYVVDTTLTSISGTVRVSSSDSSGTLRFTPNAGGESVDYVVLDTDYESYALVYQCENIQRGESQYRKVMSWKLSPNNALSQIAIDNINAIVNQIDVLNNRYYDSVDRTEAGCFYFPEANDILPVRFRGRCDENIPVVTNFNPVRYEGLWHDVQSYPEVFQDGTCNNALYTLVDGAVDVYNTQVINQTLDIMRGQAVLANNDGSAKLDVTFEVAGVNITANYWVLATDYDSYSLVYSCRPVNDEYYQVTSWKLSRDKVLSNSAIQAIDAVTKDIPVLDDRYYVHRDQSETGCFYFPEPEENKPVVFSGQCDQNIETVQNFNVAEFGGTWHEIEKYPYAVNEHQCIDHRFELDASSDTLKHSSFHVRDQRLTLVNSGNVNLNSQDGSGKLTIDIIVGTEVRTIPFWIIATDYKDYALAYGCQNINENQRQIYSWKLSRTRQPSTQSAAAIDAAMNHIQVLDNRYFDRIQQTDEACFYLPVLGPRDPVTFIGQCDPNINVISNFDATRYLGRWRLIETYYADFQVGTCSEAEYSAGDGNVIVVNSEVIDQTLNTTVGTAVVASTDGSGKLLVNFPPGTSSTDYWILGTDYGSYALVYSCQNIANDRRRVWSWKMSRTNTLTPESVTAINEIVNSVNVLNADYYQSVDRTDEGCFYYPSADVKTPVIFPGQCDENIPVVNNFNAAAYLGTWYDIESYPAPFQTGTCSKAEYSLQAENLVRVENTQVVNQRLETWIGSAVPSPDGTAKLNVTFNVNDIDVYSDYWVLATDYNSYALVYACENIDPFRRAVFSWKLSRTKSLSVEANEAINNVARDVQVLDDRYYFENGHTDEDCFYYPDNNGGDVILNGECVDDNAVPAIANFNAARFAGIWHEVSRFPSDLQVGECDSTEYSFVEPSSFTMTTSFVYNERQTNSTIQATISNDNRGVFRVNVDGVPFNSIYILDTVYEEYALAYSCRNLVDNKKQIYSWKLSRSRSGLSDQANNAIDSLITANRDLWQGYYETTRQDYDACFHYPVFGEDNLPNSIRLPGPCPTNVHGIPNFDANAYLGRWFETARYPVTNQLGQCNRAVYSLSTADGEAVVQVDNEEVAELTLFIQTGQATVASTDGSGELLVRFVVDGEERQANYYILATDYESYSLVYSCSNLPDGWRQVSSWKLSRTKTAVSNPAIDAAIAGTQGLIPEYYQSTSQSDEDCFYIPFNHINRAPLFRGQCEDIPRVTNFDIKRYEGWWHEIESFEIDGYHPGECRSSRYNDLGGGTHRVVDTWVRDNNGILLEGTATASEDGKLFKTLPDDRVQEIWVLATDYDTYAFVYSCENINEEYRRVWSAKHSRTRSLTEEAETIIAPIIRDTSVLYTQFYRKVDQTDETCFFYPNITTGQVVIPGQCNVNIPTVQEFDMRNFTGVWYDTEQYDAVTSSCVGSNYVIRDDGTIRVFNVEVVNGEEVRAEGTVTTDGATISYTYPGAGPEANEEQSSAIVLGTDYTNYAVLYNCENLDSYFRRVHAWKLSRARTMSADSNADIGRLIHERQELHQPYFNAIEQRADCPEPNSAVLFKTSITVLLIGAILHWLL